MSSSTQQAASPSQPGKGAAGPAHGAGAGRGDWLATAALVCGILGGALITIPAGLILGVLGLRRAARAGPAGRGRLRCWLAIALTLAWACAVGLLLPHLIRAADPGCEAYKDNVLTSYNRVVADVNNGAGRAVLARDLAAAVQQAGRAGRDSRNPAAARPLAALSSGLQTMLSDIQANRTVPRQVLLTLNKDTGAADAACGTV